MKGDLKAQALGIIDLQNALSTRLSDFRMKEIKSRIEFEKAKIALSDLTRHKTIELSHLPQIAGAVDPKTGKPNKEFSEFLLDEEMRNDTEFRAQLVYFYNAQESYFEAQNNMLDVAEQLSVAKSQARLLGALMILVSDDDELARTAGGTD